MAMCAIPAVFIGLILALLLVLHIRDTAPRVDLLKDLGDQWFYGEGAIPGRGIFVTDHRGADQLEVPVFIHGPLLDAAEPLPGGSA